MKLERVFGTLRNGEVRVDHQHFFVPEPMRRQGLSKDVFEHLYAGYRSAGVDVIDVCANKENGAYTWCRYGFTFRHGKKYLTNYIISSGEVNNVDVSEALAIIEKWYKDNDPRDPFPMNLLAGYSWSEKLFYKTTWEGVLRTNDTIQMQVFEEYLGSR